jgi:hypothetical protein
MAKISRLRLQSGGSDKYGYFNYVIFAMLVMAVVGIILFAVNDSKKINPQKHHSSAAQSSGRILIGYH